MSSFTPLISVVLCTYNCECFVLETIQSILNQTYSNFELIVVDDGSTDRTVEIVQNIVDARIRLFVIEHSGTDSKTRNYGIQVAQGAFITLFDGDDLYEPDALEHLAGYLLNHPDKIAVYGFFKKIDASGNLIKDQYEHLVPGEDGQLHVRSDFSQNVESFLLGRHIPIQFQGLMVHRHVLNELGGVPEVLPQMSDKLFFGRLLMTYVNRVGFVEVYVFRYRMHEHNITRSDASMEKHLYSIFQSFDLIYQYPDFPEALKENISYYTAIMLTQVYVTYKLSVGCGHHARQILRQSFHCDYLSTADWIRYCLPYYLVTWMPTSVFFTMKSVWSNQLKRVLKRFFSRENLSGTLVGRLS